MDLLLFVIIVFGFFGVVIYYLEYDSWFFGMLWAMMIALLVPFVIYNYNSPPTVTREIVSAEKQWGDHIKFLNPVIVERISVDYPFTVMRDSTTYEIKCVEVDE